MSNKRIESTNGDQTVESSEGSKSESQQQESAKLAELVSPSGTMLQDLPTELVEYILTKVVVLEVMDKRLVKRVWKEKADLVINRLRTVCSRWDDICSTDIFRNEIHGMLDAIAQPTIRSEMLHEYPIQYPVIDVTALKDEIFILYKPDDDDHVIKVFDRNNMTEVKDVIPLPGTCPVNMKACSISNNVYVLSRESEQPRKSDSVLRITRSGEHLFNVSPWIPSTWISSTGGNFSLRSISVSGYGTLTTLWMGEGMLSVLGRFIKGPFINGLFIKSSEKLN